jgi:hypothetical protein
MTRAQIPLLEDDAEEKDEDEEEFLLLERYGLPLDMMLL